MVEAGTEEGEREVTVKVTDVDELGTLAGDGTHDNAEGTDAVGTYMVTATMASRSPGTWEAMTPTSSCSKARA